MINELMKWRFACKKFDQNKLFGEEVLNELLETTLLSPSSFGLQAWKFVVVKKSAIRADLAAVCWNQPQITEAEYLVFFCADSAVLGEGEILDKYSVKYAHDLGKNIEDMAGYKKMIFDRINSMGQEHTLNWLQKQVYLPAMTLMLAAAEKQIDSCPMEGFDSAGVAKVLNLPSNLVPTVLVSLGYRAAEAPVKSRFNLNDVVVKIG